MSYSSHLRRSFDAAATQARPGQAPGDRVFAEITPAGRPFYEYVVVRQQVVVFVDLRLG